MNAIEFLEALAEKGKVSDTVVTGEVRLQALSARSETEPAAMPSGYTVENVEFEDRVIADAAHLPALLEFFACRFNSGISARNVKAAAGLAVIGCRIRAPQDSFAVRLDGCNVEGDLHFRSNVVEGHILARRMHVTGDALFNGVKAGTRETRLPEAARFYRPPSETITGERDSWLDELGGHGTSILNLRGSRIDGTLNLGGLAYERRLSVGDTERTDDDGYPELTVLAGRVDGVGLQIGQGLHLWNARILGELDLSDVQVGRAIRGETLVRPCRNGGQLACRLEVHGPLKLTHADIRGDVSLDGALIRGDLLCSLSAITGVLTGNTVHIERAQWCYTQIDGRLWLSASRIGFVALRGAEIRGALVIVTGRFNRLYLGPHLCAVPCAADSAGGLEPAPSGLEPAPGAPSQRKADEDALDQSRDGCRPFRLQLKPTQVSAVDIRSVDISEDLVLAGLDLRDATGSPERKNVLHDGGSVLINECRLGGRLGLGTDGTTETTINGANRHGDMPKTPYPTILGGYDGIDREHVADFEKLLPGPPDAAGDMHALREAWFALDSCCPAHIPGVLDLSHNSIGGELDISNMHVGREIRLDDTRVGRDLRASRFGLGRARIECTTSLYRTQCTRFEMQNLECLGDADLTGVVVRGDGPELHGPYSTIKGDLLIWSKHHDAPKGAVPADELMGADLCCGNGRLDLSAASVGRLIVSGANFSSIAETGGNGRASSSRERSGGRKPVTLGGGRDAYAAGRAFDDGEQKPVLNLEHAKVGRLEVRRPVPAKIRLSGIEVREWELTPEEETYIEVLKETDDFFSGDVYTQIEESLRNDGRNNLADDVYILMRERLEKKMWEKREYLRFGLSRIHRALTKYGTSAMRPFLWIVLIASINYSLLHDPRNVVASTAYMESMTEQELDTAKRNAAGAMLAVYGASEPPVVIDLRPDALGYRWTVGDVLGITARFSVPLIALAINDRWDPARWNAIVPCPGALVGRPPEGYCTLPVKVVTVARVLGYLSWIFWPLFILRVSSVIKRRD